ncbi:MAG: DUF2849 domain-containing protein [Rhodospirillales bacterium]|jgi:hypothetical protein|nr:DUF2849 domain-containing protein [Rhodospirillales bacterium]MBT4038582.1 DUF2849 domain-containing protein [Rhodospirillales bacterium]MBT4625316.1 DUF2849 domain-containing protein [Rhodospirillales bacterium]MBT5353264.1 DUF2849 domain-containing protein [Rhodospirillales bacterium]MBT5521761.1 DUF2849 domain-containing protein [Rhodospirillales bacterium]
MSLQIITANRLVDGAVVYYTTDNDWSQWIADAVISDDTASAEPALAFAKADAFANGIIEPYLVDVYREAQTIKPVRYREAIRARGPSIYTSSEHGMPVAAKLDAKYASAGTATPYLNGL